MRIEKILSAFDGLVLEAAVSVPEGNPKGVIQFSHGMAEHKERYFDFMTYLSRHGYACVIHDHRGHGESVETAADYGYFYTENEQAIIEDLYTVTGFIKQSYPGLPVFLFSHSMGTLVARGYLKKYDSEIDKAVLCGPPTYNAAAGLGLFLARLSKPFLREKAPNKMLNAMAFSQFNAGNTIANGWLSENLDNVRKYNQDPKCGFIFTTNGFINLLKLQKAAFEKGDWHVRNPNLPIFVIAGAEDPVIGSKKRFEQLTAFLSELGYTQISSKLYEHMRHEILNEEKKLDVYQDILQFFEESRQ